VNSADPRRLVRQGPGWKHLEWFSQHRDWLPDRLTRPTPCCTGPYTPASGRSPR
jgi:hypothetical protein